VLQKHACELAGRAGCAQDKNKSATVKNTFEANIELKSFVLVLQTEHLHCPDDCNLMLADGHKGALQTKSDDTNYFSDPKIILVGKLTLKYQFFATVDAANQICPMRGI
jgi:hypothetical protein